MIKVIFNDYTLDLTNVSVKLVQKNNMFRAEKTKNFSYPFYLDLNEDIARALGIMNIKNIIDYETKIDAKVLENDTFYDGYLEITKIVGIQASVTLYYGHETLEVYDKALNELPFEIVTSTPARYFAKDQITKQWPEATHNYPTIYNDQIKKETNYEGFLDFINNYDVDSESFLINSYETIDVGDSGETEEITVNRNVMTPMPYLMEILRVGYATEGLTMKGTFAENTFNHKLVHVPDVFLEQFLTNQLDIWSFDMPTQNYIANGVVISEYSKTHQLATVGSYDLKFDLNLPIEFAQLFSLVIRKDNDTIYEASSEGTEVYISETLNINTESIFPLTDLTIELKLAEQTESIAALNIFTFEFSETKLNVFPDTYNLADFMPDCTFREFENAIANWFNLDIDVIENIVYLNYIDQAMPAIIYKEHTHKQIEYPSRETNSNKVFSLKYNDGQQVYTNKTGKTYSTTGVLESNITTIEIPVYPLVVANKGAKFTAAQTEEDSLLKVAIFDGMQNGEPLSVNNFQNNTLLLDDIHKLYWTYWLKFRTNSEIIEDVFFAHVSDKFYITQGMIKYNQKHLIKEITKQSVNDTFNKVTVTSETII